MNRLDRNRNNFYTDYDIQLHPDASVQKWLTYANYYVVDNFLTDTEIGQLSETLSTYDSRTFKGAVLGHSSEKSAEYGIRDSSIYFIGQNDKDFSKWDDLIVERSIEVNKNIFNLNLTTSMWPQYTSYGVGQHFSWHPDGPFGVMDGRGMNMIPNDLMWRKLSLSIAINSPESYDGGDFQIMNPSANPECNAINNIRLDRGSAIFFPAFCAHKVSPVTNGKRKSLVYWFCGPRWS